MRRIALGLALVALVGTGGCYARSRGGEEAGPPRRVAVLPVVNQTWADGRTEPLLAAVETTLASEKRVAVVPRAELVSALNRPAGAGALSLLQLGELSPEKPEWPSRPLETLTRALEADAVLAVRLDAFERTSEERLNATGSGALAPGRVPLTVVKLSGALWRASDRSIAWRGRYEARQYDDPAAPGTSAEQALAAAARQLLATFPAAPAPASTLAP